MSTTTQHNYGTISTFTNILYYLG